MTLTTCSTSVPHDPTGLELRQFGGFFATLSALIRGRHRPRIAQPAPLSCRIGLTDRFRSLRQGRCRPAVCDPIHCTVILHLSHVSGRPLESGVIAPRIGAYPPASRESRTAPLAAYISGGITTSGLPTYLNREYPIRVVYVPSGEPRRAPHAAPPDRSSSPSCCRSRVWSSPRGQYVLTASH